MIYLSLYKFNYFMCHRQIYPGICILLDGLMSLIKGLTITQKQIIFCSPYFSALEYQIKICLYPLRYRASKKKAILSLIHFLIVKFKLRYGLSDLPIKWSILPPKVPKKGVPCNPGPKDPSPTAIGLRVFLRI